jgi:hypothetical protein
MWPDTSEFGADELFPTIMTNPNGPAPLYSAYNSPTVDRHFEWMRDHNLDGVMLQRFVCDLHEKDLPERAFRDQVALNVKASAEKRPRRAFCIMYDITGSNEDTFVQDLKDDWAHLVDDDPLKITTSPSYLKHKGKPLLAIWGLGFKTNPGTASQAKEIITHFQTDPPDNHQVTLLGGIPANWRTPQSDGDSKTDDPTVPSDQTWLSIYSSFNVLSPWTVGDTGADNKIDRIKQDLQYLRAIENQTSREVGYMPVVFPGYSWKNTGEKLGHPEYTLNQIPRDGGRFWWRQVYNAIQAFKEIAPKNMMIYGAMFDEVNEGTAMYKLATNIGDMPKELQGNLVYLNIDRDKLPNVLKNLTSDYYLWLADKGSRMLRGDDKLTPNMPIRDQPTPLPNNWFNV